MGEPGRSLPMGTVTFLFSDIEGSTRLVQQLGTATYRELLEQHHRLLRSAVEAHEGIERGTQGDSFLVIFRDAPSAVAAAVDAQRAFAATVWPSRSEVRVRMGLHSGEGIPGGDDYVGLDINRAARIAGAAHGGEVLVSDATRALVARRLPNGVVARDVGLHRLRGLVEPERLHRLLIDGLPNDFPPPRGLSTGLGDMPPRVTSFVGRDAAVDEVGRLVAENRLVTLVGPGGTGKTSLATEVARHAAGDYGDGVWFIALEPITDAGEVGPAIVAGLGLQDRSGRSARDRLADNLAARSLLLVIDNFEHVLDAAPLVGDLLAAAPAIRILVTSRAPLHVSGEQLYPVAPLELPPLDGASDAARFASVPSIALFVDRARRVQPAFALAPDIAEAVADICRRVDGLPLGIELAAAKIGLLGVVGIRDRLAGHLELPASSARGMPTRQRTLRDTIRWSHDLLDPSTRGLFARLSVFAGGFRLSQAEAVGDARDRGDEILEGLARLVDESLVTVTEARGVVRYGMLETIREFAAQRLEPDERRLVLERHAGAYLALVEANARAIDGRSQVTAVARIAEDWNNVLSSARWSIDTGNTEMALRFAAAMWRFWWLRGDIAEGRSTTAAALAMPGAEEVTTHQMRAHEAMGGLLYYSGDNDLAVDAYNRQLQLARELSDLKGIADARFNLAFTLDFRGRPAVARAFFDDVAEAYRAAGDEVGVARAAWLHANLLYAEGDAVAGRQAMESAMRRFQELGDLPYELLAASGLAMVCLQAGESEGAVSWLLYALVRNEERQDAAGIAVALPLVAAVAFRVVGAEAAATILGAFEGFSRRQAMRMPKSLEHIVDVFQPWKAAQAALDEATYAAALARGSELTVTEVVDFVVDALQVTQAQAPSSPR